MKTRIYIASKTKHANRWRMLRDEHQVPIISSWIDEAGEGQTEDWGELWHRIQDEILSSNVLVLYREPNEVLKGALAELGMAVMVPKFNYDIFALGHFPDEDRYSVVKHPSVNRIEVLPSSVNDWLLTFSLCDAIENS